MAAELSATANISRDNFYNNHAYFAVNERCEYCLCLHNNRHGPKAECFQFLSAFASEIGPWI